MGDEVALTVVSVALFAAADEPIMDGIIKVEILLKQFNG